MEFLQKGVFVIMDKLKVLIVDDIEANRIALEAILESEDVEIIKVSSGNEALKVLLKNDNIDIVLLDVQMPDMDGFEVAEIMKSDEKTREIPIIFITAISKEEKFVCKGYEMGAVDYIYKPVNYEILKSKIKVFIRLNNQTKKIAEESKKMQQKIYELEIAKEKLRKIADRDGLTGLYNRRSFDRKLDDEWKRCSENKKELSLIIMDIDFFKRYNDDYGHLEGDDCLKEIAKQIKNSLERSTDLLARWGGEEFIVILPETDIDSAEKIANEIREAVENLKIEHKSSNISNYITASLGVSTIIPDESVTKKEFIKLADCALYEAKNRGRNCVVENTRNNNLERTLEEIS